MIILQVKQDYYSNLIKNYENFIKKKANFIRVFSFAQ